MGGVFGRFESVASGQTLQYYGFETTDNIAVTLGYEHIYSLLMNVNAILLFFLSVLRFVTGLRSNLQVDLGALVRIRGLATQGRHEAAEWVSSFVLSYSSVATNFRFYEVNSTLKVIIPQLIILL